MTNHGDNAQNDDQTQDDFHSISLIADPEESVTKIVFCLQSMPCSPVLTADQVFPSVTHKTVSVSRKRFAIEVNAGNLEGDKITVIHTLSAV